MHIFYFFKSSSHNFLFQRSDSNFVGYGFIFPDAACLPGRDASDIEKEQWCEVSLEHINVAMDSFIRKLEVRRKLHITQTIISLQVLRTVGTA